MNLFSPCARYRPRICLSAADRLPAAEADTIKKHLATCPDCRQYYQSITSVTASLENWKEAFARLEPSASAQHRWAEAILAANRVAPMPRPTMAQACRGWFQEVVHPYRHAWTVLAAVWVLIVLGNLSLPRPGTLTPESPRAAQEAIAALKDRQKNLAELLPDYSQPHEADRRRPFPAKPRTENKQVLTT